MARQECRRRGAHACAFTLAHFMEAPWVMPVDYVPHMSDRPSPSAYPPRREAVEGHLALFRALPAGRLYPRANRLHARLWRRFRQRWKAAMAALPGGARARILGKLRLIAALEDDGLNGHANGLYREIYRRLGLELDVRALEEVAEAFNASLEERLAADHPRGHQLRIRRFVDFGEVESAAKSGILAHNRGQCHLSFAFVRIPKFEDRPAVLSLGITSSIAGRLTAVSYRSAAFSAPGSRPAFVETWLGTKSWWMGSECEVRLRTPVLVSAVDLVIHLKFPIGGRAHRSLRRLCGTDKVLVSPSWPPDL